MGVPSGTVSQRARAGAAAATARIDADVWFSNWERGGTLLEEARYLTKWDQTLSLLWFETEVVPTLGYDRRERRWEVEGREPDEPREEEEEEDENGLMAPDGNLRWPGKRRHR